MSPNKKPKKHKSVEVCRICLSAKDANCIEFHFDGEWSRLIDYCFGISITAESGPRILCYGCSIKLHDYSEFKKLALKSDTQWSKLFTKNIKTDLVENLAPIEIKDENDSDTCNDMAYLDVDFSIDVPNNEIKNQEIAEVEIPFKDESNLSGDSTGKEYCIKTENEVDGETGIKSKKSKKQSKDKGNIAKNDLKGLSGNAFIKKFFDVITLKKGKWKEKYVCLKCGDELKLRKCLPLHVQKCHEAEVLIIKQQDSDKTSNQSVKPSIFDCGLCNFQNADEEIVTKHVNEHHCLTNDLKCKLCEYAGRDMADVITHRYKHLPERYKYRGKYRCPTCNKVRMNELCLQFHYRSLHLKKSGGWCPTCNKTFTGYIYFRNHVRLHAETNYICDLCGAKFLFRNLIVAHLKEHMNVRNYICDTCGKSFKRNNALSGHIRAYHTDLKPVPCDHCNKQFKNSYSLAHHMKMVRKGNNYVCDVCCKGYPTMSLLKKHMFWHTGERPFSCETCGGKYKSKGNLKLHMKKHMGVYPFHCDTCGKQFTTSTQLRVHASVHTGIRRVKCLVCDKTFHEKRQMLAHCQSKHESFNVKHESQGPSVAQNPQVHGHNNM